MTTPNANGHQIHLKFYVKALRNTAALIFIVFNRRIIKEMLYDGGRRLVKQVIVVRKDLGMGIGKIIGQACHACLGASEEARKYNLNLWKKWYAEGTKKIIVKVNSLEELLELEHQVKKSRLPSVLVIDRGLTQLPPETPTALGIGPVEDCIVDKITGDLKLL